MQIHSPGRCTGIRFLILWFKKYSTRQISQIRRCIRILILFLKKYRQERLHRFRDLSWFLFFFLQKYGLDRLLHRFWDVLGFKYEVNRVLWYKWRFFHVPLPYFVWKSAFYANELLILLFEKALLCNTVKCLKSKLNQCFGSGFDEYGSETLN